MFVSIRILLVHSAILLLFAGCRSDLIFRDIYPVAAGRRGLINLGNTCYFNSIIQILVHTPAVHSALRQIPDSSPADPPIADFGRCLSRVASAAWTRDPEAAPSMDPKRLLKSFYVTNPHFATEHGQQQDAHEFFTSIVNEMKESISTESVARLFGFTSRQSKTCAKCAVSKTVVANEIGLTLHLGGMNRKVLLEDLLRATLAMGYALTRSNRMHCDHCQALNVGIDSQRLASTPRVLVIQIGRFTNDGRKIPSHVDFPLTDLDLSGYVDSFTAATGASRFRLAGVVVHAGNELGTGHYFAYVRHPGAENLWLRMSDQDVEEVASTEVLEAQAYMLFYTRQD